MDYVVRLEQFEGPLDLLLHLIRRAQIDIKDIFLSQITEQYLATIRQAESMDMDVSSAFVAMAATLLEIKSRALLPRPPKVSDADDEQEDPEAALIRQLTEYKLFKEASEEMRQMERIGKQMYFKLPEELPPPGLELDLEGVDTQGLYEAFSNVLLRKMARQQAADRPAREIQRDVFTISGKMVYIQRKLKGRGRVRFDALFGEAATREEVIVTFIAMLELLRLGRIGVRQTQQFGPIDIRWMEKEAGSDAAQ
nr:segregation/condensation protein A [Maliibacterium massiliense]